jgi:hypothetical protein
MRQNKSTWLIQEQGYITLFSALLPMVVTGTASFGAARKGCYVKTAVVRLEAHFLGDGVHKKGFGKVGQARETRAENGRFPI